MKKNIVTIALLAFLLILTLLVAALAPRTASMPSVPTEPQAQVPANTVIADVTYQCQKKMTIHAIFNSSPDTVVLTLSDGRSMTLPHALSADGARYTNADESFVFWNKGNTAFITEGGQITFADCVDANAVSQ